MNFKATSCPTLDDTAKLKMALYEVILLASCADVQESFYVFLKYRTIASWIYSAAPGNGLSAWVKFVHAQSAIVRVELLFSLYYIILWQSSQNLMFPQTPRQNFLLPLVRWSFVRGHKMSLLEYEIWPPIGDKIRNTALSELCPQEEI